MCLPVADSRVDLMRIWLQDTLSITLNDLQPASSDASFRRYFRCFDDNGSSIVMDAPPDKENTGPFLQVAALFRQADIHVPAVYQQNRVDGFLLLEDFGSTCYLDHIDVDNADRLYADALDTLFRLQTRLSPASSGLPAYDAALLERELGIFHEWLLHKRLGLIVPEQVSQDLHRLLIDSALAQPIVCVHRDFHSRNLMFIANNNPGVIDFQDAVNGPITYDLVSLLRDCYLQWPPERVDAWLESYFRRLVDAELIAVDYPLFKRWFDLMGLQRHLKAIGIFSRLDLRDGKAGYLADIPRTLRYVQQVCQTYPELAEFNRYLDEHVYPAFQVTV